MPPIRDKFTIHSKAVVCQDVELKGDFTVGAGTIVHPKATIFAIAGPIVIGAGCIIEEGVILVSRQVLPSPASRPLTIGCRVECPSIGNFNTISARARVHHTVRISSYCVIGAACLVVPTEDEILDEYTVIYGPAAERRIWSGRGKTADTHAMARRSSSKSSGRDFQPAYDAATYRDLLLFEERLKTNAASLNRRKHRYQLFLAQLLVIITFLASEVLLQTNVLSIPYAVLLRAVFSDLYAERTDISIHPYFTMVHATGFSFTARDASTDPANSTNSTVDMVVAAWYTGWHSEDFTLNNVSWDKYTHLIYSFAATGPTSNVSLNGSDPELLLQFVSTAHGNAQSPHIFTHASGVPLRLGDSPSTTDYRVEIEPVTYGLPTLPNLWWNDDLRLFEYQKDSGEHKPVLVQEPEREGEKRIWAFFHDTVTLEEQQKQTRAYLDTKGKAAERIRKIQDERPKPATPAAIRRELSKHEATSPAVGTSPLVHVVPEVGTSSLTQYSSNLATGVEKKPLEPELETQSNEPEPESEPEYEPESDDAMSTTRTSTATKLEVPAPDKFKGQATDAKPFIRRLEMYYSATGNANANDQRKIAYALLLIDDNSDAFYWKKLHMDGEADAQEEGKHAFESWKDFKEAFLKAFPVYAEGDRDSIMLTTLKQGKTPTPAFIPKFRSIASRTDLSDKTLSGFFKRAIRRDLLDKAMNMEPPTT
ncbi:hypothetical protein EVJ58_g8915, partial [Rhodofomes roseus]